MSETPMNKLRELCEKLRNSAEDYEENAVGETDAYSKGFFKGGAAVRDEDVGLLEAILPDVERLIKALRWARDYIQDGLERPIHACEYNSNPEKGACDFCEKWADIEVMLDQPVAPKKTE